MIRRNLFKAAAGAIASLPFLKAIEPAPVEAAPCSDWLTEANACVPHEPAAEYDWYTIEVARSYNPTYLPNSDAMRDLARWVEAKEPPWQSLGAWHRWSDGEWIPEMELTDA